jgi:Nuclease-related domain
MFERARAARLRRGESAPSAYERAWEKGYGGEVRLGSELNEAAQLCGGSWVLHDLVVPGQRRNIDHLVIGPAGVTVIDAKAWAGKVWVGRLGIGRGRRASPKEIDGVSRQVNRVHSVLARAGRDDVRVEGLVCMVNDNDGIPTSRLADIRGIGIGRRGPVAKHALRDGPLDLLAVEQVKRLLEDGFEIHGGTSAGPTERFRRLAPPRVAPRSAPEAGLLLRLGRICLAGILAITIVTVAASIALDSVRPTIDRYRYFSRAELRAQKPELRRLAVREAHGRVSGPKLRVTTASFVLTYRRGRHCRVVIELSRALKVLGGGAPTVTSTGCTHRHAHRPA